MYFFLYIHYLLEREKVSLNVKKSEGLTFRFGEKVVRFRAKKEQLKRCQGRSPESQGQNVTLTVFNEPYLLDSCDSIETCLRVRSVALGKSSPPGP